MKNPITTTLDQSLLKFLNTEASRQKVNRNTILEKALKLYRNVVLAKEIKKGLLDRKEEYKEIAGDYTVLQKYVLRDL